MIQSAAAAAAATAVATTDTPLVVDERQRAKAAATTVAIMSNCQGDKTIVWVPQLEPPAFAALAWQI